MSDLTPFFSPHDSGQDAPEPPRKTSVARRVAIGVTCGVIGLGLLGTTAAFAAQGGPADTQAVSAMVSPTATPTPGAGDGSVTPVPPSDAPTAPAEGTTPPTDAPTPGTGADCGPGGAGPRGEGALAGGPAGGAAPIAPKPGAEGAPTPPTDGPTPPTDAPTPPTDAPAPPTDAPTPPSGTPDGGSGDQPADGGSGS